MSRNSFLMEDYKKAKLDFAAWQSATCETIDNYVLRKRKAELNELVKKVIKNELSEQEQEMVDLHWYQGASIEEIANRFGFDKTTVYRRFEKINNLIYEKLKYALQYRYAIDSQAGAQIMIAKKINRKAVSNSSEIAMRILKLRQDQFLDLKTVSDMTQISLSRLKRLENSLEPLTLNDVQKFSLAFEVPTDFLIFGTS